MLWAVHALQSDYSGAGRRFLRPETVPDGAVTPKMTSKFFVQKWEIETLANELMTTPKTGLQKNGKIRQLSCDHFGAATDCVNWLQKLENVEYRVHKRPDDIWIEMGRIAARQFGWQRGFVNIPQFYRYAFVYGQGECAAYFEEKNGVSLNRFSQIGFMLYVSLIGGPVTSPQALALDRLGITDEEVERVLSLIAKPFKDAAKLARANRRKIIHTADKPSILRQYPCLRFGDGGERLRAPLPELIIERVTSGVFYDVVDGGGAIRDEYGRRFEDYSFQLLSKTLTDLEWGRETSYRKKPHKFQTPDILCSSKGKLEVVFECKATRMSQEAMFGRDPLSERGYKDLTKAVFQLWRFFSHCRRGYLEREVSDEVVGVVLTLDNWLVLADTFRNRVLEDAAKLAGEKDREIIAEDRVPIVFLAAQELERTLTVATSETFKDALLRANSQEFSGWRLDGIHRQIGGKNLGEKRDYPFSDDLGRLLPWWEELNHGELSVDSNSD